MDTLMAFRHYRQRLVRLKTSLTSKIQAKNKINYGTGLVLCG